MTYREAIQKMQKDVYRISGICEGLRNKATTAETGLLNDLIYTFRESSHKLISLHDSLSERRAQTEFKGSLHPHPLKGGKEENVQECDASEAS